MIRAVLDTNVYVSALINPAGAPGIVLSKWLSGEFENILSQPILDEIERSLQYPKVRKYVKLTGAELRTLLVSFSVLAVPVEPQQSDLPPVRDPNDVPVLWAAFYAKARFLVTGDEDLLQLRAHAGVRMVTSREFLKFLEAGAA